MRDWEKLAEMLREARRHCSQMERNKFHPIADHVSASIEALLPMVEMMVRVEATPNGGN